MDMICPLCGSYCAERYWEEVLLQHGWYVDGSESLDTVSCPRCEYEVSEETHELLSRRFVVSRKEENPA